MDKKEKTKKIILYLINKLDKSIEGKKKLMKIMFLLEHYDFVMKKLTRAGSIGNSFKIYYYGVFSREVMDYFDELVAEKKITVGFPLRVSKEVVELNDLEEGIRNKVNDVIDNFGKKSGYELEIATLKMLGIEPYQKKEYFGREVSELIKL